MDCLVGNGKGGTNQQSQMNLSLSHRFQWHLFEYAPCHARPSGLKARHVALQACLGHVTVRPEWGKFTGVFLTINNAEN
jgi:hypothetical protein